MKIPQQNEANSMHQRSNPNSAPDNTGVVPMQDDAQAPSQLTRTDMDAFFEALCVHTDNKIVKRFRNTLLKYIRHLTLGISNTPQKKLRQRKHVLVPLWDLIMTEGLLSSSVPHTTATLIKADLVDLTRFTELYKDDELKEFLHDFAESLQNNSAKFMHDASSQVPLQITTGTQVFYQRGSPLPEISEIAEGTALYSQNKIVEAIATYNAGLEKIERIPHHGEYFIALQALLNCHIVVADFTLAEEYLEKNDIENAYKHALLSISRLGRIASDKISHQIMMGRAEQSKKFFNILNSYVQHLQDNNRFAELIAALAHLRYEVAILKLSSPSNLDITKYVAVTFYKQADYCHSFQDRELVLSSLSWVLHETLKILAIEKDNQEFIKLLLMTYESMIKHKLAKAADLIDAKEFMQAIKLNVECITQSRLARALLKPGAHWDLTATTLASFDKHILAYVNSANRLGDCAILVANIYTLLNNDLQLVHVTTSSYLHICMSHALHNHTKGDHQFALQILVFVAGTMQLVKELLSADGLLNYAYNLEKAFIQLATSGYSCDQICVYNTKKMIAAICMDKAIKLKRCLPNMPGRTKLFLEANKQLAEIPEAYRAVYQNQSMQVITQNLQNSQEWLLIEMRKSINKFIDKIRNRISLFNEKQQRRFGKYTTPLQLLITTLNMQIKESLPELAELKQMQLKIENQIDQVRNDYPYLNLIYDVRSCVVNLIYIEEQDLAKIETSSLLQSTAPQSIAQEATSSRRLA
jgi:hypothetical protein